MAWTLYSVWELSVSSVPHCASCWELGSSVPEYGYSLFTVVQAIRGVPEPRSGLHTLVPAATDWMCGIATALAMYPLIRLGLGYFTTHVNDFPDNAAASEEWLSRSGIGPKFLDKHPDDFGLYHLFVARFDKPGTTAVGVFAKLVSGIPTYTFLAPISIVSVLVLTSNLAAAIRRVFNTRALTASAAALIPALSIVPMSRVTVWRSTCQPTYEAATSKSSCTARGLLPQNSRGS